MMQLRNIAVSVILTTICGGWLSCTKEDDYKKYVGNEERLYRAKPLNLNAKSGHERMEISFVLYHPIHVENYEIYADGTRVADGTVDYADTVGITRLIENLEEKSYTIDVYTIDDMGNRSVKSSTFANVFGERYIAGINQRPVISSTYPEPGVLNLIWSAAEDNVVRSEIRYIDHLGVLQTKFVAHEDQATTIADIGTDGKLEYRTYVLPDTSSIDTLVSGWELLNLASPPIYWYSSEETQGEGPSNGSFHYLFDGQLDTYWHTQYVGQLPGYPHWFIVDLGESQPIDKFSLARRIGNGAVPSAIKIEVRDLDTDWALVGMYQVDTTVDGLQSFNAQHYVEGRYFRFTALEGPTTHMCLSEFEINPSN